VCVCKEKPVPDHGSGCKSYIYLTFRRIVDSLVDTTNKKQAKSVLEKISKNSKGAKEAKQVYDQAYDETVNRIEGQTTNKRALARNVLP
jgi:hypothetical protein